MAREQIGSTYRVGPGDPDAKPKAPIGFRPPTPQAEAPQASTSPAPEVIPAPEVPPTPVTAAPSVEQPTPEALPEPPKSFKEVLALQKDAFSARREMIAFRRGGTIESLKSKIPRYKELREISREKRKAWMAELDKLSEEEQEELKGLTKLKEVEARFTALPPEQIVVVALDSSLAEMKNELAELEAQIAGLTSQGVTIRRREDDLKELTARRRVLYRKIDQLTAETAQSSNNPAGETVIHPAGPEVPPGPAPAPAPEIPLGPMPTPEAPPGPAPSPETAPRREQTDFERAQAEAKTRRRELLRAAMGEVEQRILAKTVESDKLPRWNVIGIMRAENQLNDLRRERTRLDRELNERVGFGTKFKEATSKAYKSVRDRIRGEQPATISSNEAPAEVIIPNPDTPAESIETEQDEKGSFGKWCKQRLWGVGTVGFKEFRPAEKFRVGTKEVRKDVQSYARLIQKEKDLPFDQAEKEAWEIMAKMKAEGIDTAADPRFLQISAEITERKVVENEANIDRIVLTAIDDLERKLKGYKGDMGQDVLTEENKNRIATEMRANLRNLRTGQAEADVKQLTELIRGNLDDKYWRRYLYTAADAVLWGLAIKWIGGKLLSGKVKEVIVTKGGAAASKEATQVVIKDTIWGEAKRQLISHSVANPTNAQIQQVALKFCQDSGVKVVTKGGELLWQQTASGVFRDIALSKDFVIHMASGLKQIAAIKAGLVAGAV